MGVSRRGPGANSHPLEFENADVICCFFAKHPKFLARAVGAPIKYTSNFCLKRKKFANLLFLRGKFMIFSLGLIAFNFVYKVENMQKLQ